MDSTDKNLKLEDKNIDHLINKINDQICIDKITTEKNETFDCLIINHGLISDLSWSDPNYLKKLMELDLFESINVNQDNFVEIISTKLNVNKYSDVKNLSVKNEIICEEPYYLYELLYVDLEKETQYHSNINELASLINSNCDKIYSSAILFRNHLPSLTDSMTMCDVSKQDLERILYERVNTKVVIWDDEWREDIVLGDLQQYAKIFFEGESYKKLEIGFLMHNINIWYISANSDYLGKKVCGNIITKPIEKCIWFTMKSDEYRGNLTLDEVNKIIYLSNKLDNYQTPGELLEEKIDKLGRKIIYNKYKVLDLLYNKYK
jgi:hypothetical protein